jgi:hypothetical protein
MEFPNTLCENNSIKTHIHVLHNQCQKGEFELTN